MEKIPVRRAPVQRRLMLSQEQRLSWEAPTTFGPCGRWLWTGRVEVSALGKVLRVALPLAEEEGGFVDEDSDQPAFEGAFVFELWWIARGGKVTVSDRRFGYIDGGEDAACDEMKHLAAAGKLQLEGALDVFAGFAVGFKVAATNGKVGLLDAFRGNRKFWGGVCHKHVSVLQLV